MNIARLRDEGSGMMNRLHVWTLDYGNIECGNEMLSDVVLRERQEAQGSKGKAGISINLAAKWRV